MNRAPSLRLASSLEILETRIAPAAVFTFTDADGHDVTITSSKGTPAQLQAALSPAPIDAVTPTQILTLTLGSVFKGADISVIAGANAADTIFTKIGFLNAGGVDLGKVVIDGELNRIVAGDANAKTAGLKGLTLQTFGKIDVTPGDQAGEFDSKITGTLAALRVEGDVQGAFLLVTGSNPDLNVPDGNGRIGSIFLGGSLLGTARDFGGAIVATGDVGKVEVGGSIAGFAAAGMAVEGQQRNAQISAGRAMGAVTIAGGITGGDGAFSGQIDSGRGIKSLTVQTVKGGFGERSGVVIGGFGTLGNVEITGDLQGGGGTKSGRISSDANMRAVTVAGSVLGGEGDESGQIGAAGAIASVLVQGSLRGGGGDFSGQIGSAFKIGAVTIEGDLRGGAGFESGAIGSFFGLGTITIKGSIIAGAGERSALITTQDTTPSGTDFAAPISKVIVLGSIDASGSAYDDPPAGTNSAGILASGNLGIVEVGGNVLGGAGASSGRIASAHDIRNVTIGGNLAGGGGINSGGISALGTLGTVVIGAGAAGGNVIGGSNDFAGSIFSAEKITRVEILGNVSGGSGTLSGVIQANEEGMGAADIGSIFIRGNLQGGSGVQSGAGGFGSGSIYADGKIRSIVIGDVHSGSPDRPGGNVIGGDAAGSGVISASGDITAIELLGGLQGGDVGNGAGRILTGGKLTRLTLGGSIVGGAADQFSADEFGTHAGQVYANRSIGKVTVGGGLFGGVGKYGAQIRGASIGTVSSVFSIQGGGGEGTGALIAFDGDIRSVTISGFDNSHGSPVSSGLVAGSGPASGWIAASEKVGSVQAGYLSGSGQARPRISGGESIGTVALSEGSFNGDIFAGYGVDGAALTGDASIGTVRIGAAGSDPRSGAGNMQATNIVAGFIASNDGDGFFGTNDDELIHGSMDKAKVFSKIASVIVYGQVLPPGGGAGQTAHFGVVAQQIGSIKVAGVSLALKSGVENDPLHPFRFVGANTGATTYGEIAGPLI